MKNFEEVFTLILIAGRQLISLRAKIAADPRERMSKLAANYHPITSAQAGLKLEVFPHKINTFILHAEQSATCL